MKRTLLFPVVVLIVTAGIFVALTVDGNEAAAYSNGWAGGCGTCHGGAAAKVAPPAHNVPAHQSFWGTCISCHALVPGDSPAASKCGGCHGGVVAIAARPTHTASGCAVTGCHAASTTTTTRATTTTTRATTTTTQATTTTHATTTTTQAATTTTVPSTTTTQATATTSTTAAPSTTTTTPPPPPFSDVPPGHPYDDAITALAAAGVVDGYPEPGGGSTFRPDGTILRRQFAKVIVGALGIPVSEADVCPFPDVDVSGPDAFYPDNYVAVAALRGITRGTTSDPPRFSPWREITRAQVLTMVVRAASSELPYRLTDPPAAFSGVLPADDPTHGANVRAAEWNGLLDGIEPNGSGPAEWDILAPASRGEVAQILWNVTR